MRRISGKRAVMALGLVLAGGMTMGVAAEAKDKPAAAPAKVGNSKEFATAAGPLQATLQGAQPAIQAYVAAQGPAKEAAMAQLKAAFAPAPAQLAVAEAAIKTPGDRLLAGQWGSQIGSVLGDPKLVQHSVQNIVESGVAPADKLDSYRFQLGNAAYSNKDYAGAIAAITPLVAANYSDDIAAELLADAYAKQGQPAQGLAAMKTAIDARKKAGGKVPEAWYTRANTIAYTAKLNKEGLEWAMMLAGANPSPKNWLGAGQLVRLYGSYGPQDALDISRLLFRAGALNGNNKDIEREYVEYVQDADPRRLPGEALAAAKAGIAAGALRANDTFVADAIAQSQGRVAADKASLPGAARNASTGVLALAVADGFLSYGQAAEAEAMYKAAIAKGGIDKDRATLRLGIAQADQGKNAEAKATFAQVVGAHASIAQLWSTWLTTKGA